MSRKQRAAEKFGTVETELQGLSTWMYENPELAFQEFESSRRLSEVLAAHGFAVSYPAYGLDTSFEANVGTTGPRVVICAEYDALPGVGHACGHNIIATAAVGAGIAVAAMADELGIRLTVLGTPAEEGGGGKVDLIDAGAFDDCAAAMMVHPSPRDMLDPAFLAINSYVVEYYGKESHASFSPQVGINALDAAVQAYNNVSTLRQHFLPTDRVHGMIRNGGEAPNIIPAYTKSQWIIRAATGERLKVLTSRVISCFEAAATATGCRVEITPNSHTYIDMVNNPVMTALYGANSEVLGRTMPTRAGSGETSAASSDMGNVSHLVPSIHPGIGIETDAVNHQPEFAAATITASGHRALRDGAVTMAHTIIDMAENDVWDTL
jgi:amidohydrolase